MPPDSAPGLTPGPNPNAVFRTGIAGLSDPDAAFEMTLSATEKAPAMQFPLSQPPQPDAAAASDAASLAYLARRGVAPQWRGFLRGLIETLDGHLDPSARNSLLRAVGAHLGTQLPLPACNSLGDLELRMNEALATIEWGFVKLAVSHDGSIRLAHRLAPLVTTLGDAGGNWLVAALEGLYGTWLSSQPGADRLLQPRHAGGEASGTVVLRYGAE